MKGIEYMPALTDFLRWLWKRQNGLCYYTNRQMELAGYHQMKPNAVTIDRVDPKKGYVAGNIVLCCSIVNRAKQDMDYQQFIDFCQEILDES